MLTSLMEELIRRDLMLSAMCTVDTRRYIVSSWNRTHPEPIDENAVALFLCDENQGSLTDEQRALPGSAGKRCPPVMRGWCSGFCCGRRCPVWGSCPGWTSTAGCFCRWTVPFGKGRIAPLNGLCGAVCPPLGWGKVPVPSGFARRIWAAAEGKWGPRQSPAQRVCWGGRSSGMSEFSPFGRK